MSKTIENLKKLKSLHNGSYGADIDKAIKAIEALEQEPSSDCISRQAAIDAVRKNTFRLTFAEEQGCKGHVAWSAEAVYSDAIKGALLELPSVTPKPTMGQCRDCKHFEYDSVAKVDGIPLIVAHEICSKWGKGNGCKTRKDGYCHLFESQEESEDKGMNNLEKAKEIVKTYYSAADHGIFSSQNIAGDAMETIYEGEGLTIDVCYGYSYFEVFGLSDAEFEELERYYDSLRRK